MSSSKKNKDEPELDPYEVLGIEAGVSDAAITKAYRKLALKLHPDKQGSHVSAVEAERVAVEFQNIQQARAFLLDAEFREARVKYDAKRASIQRRRQAEKERELNMNERRKRMREDLKRKEDEARKRSKTTTTASSRRSKHSSNSSQQHDDELLEKLRREGGNMRQAYAEKEQEATAETRRQQAQQEAKSRKEQLRLLEDRQIRLKWSRKKMKTSPSEDSIATLLARFGTVEHVEMLGAKGNLALVTFADPSACRPCVEAFEKSEEMRASFVGKRKEEEELRQAAAEEEQDHKEGAPAAVRSRDKESLYDRNLRQEAERQRLRREMEQEEMGETTQQSKQHEKGLPPKSDFASSSTVSVQFPSTESYKKLSPIEKLEKAESDILGKLLPQDRFARLKAVHA